MYNQAQRQQYYADPASYRPQPEQQYRVPPVWTNSQPQPQARYQPQQSAYPPHQNRGYDNRQQNAVPQFLNNQPKEKSTIRQRKKETHKDHFLKGVEVFQKEWSETWIKQELNFTMNKISVAGLLFGLMFLGSVFFLIGFLVAFNLYSHKPNEIAVVQQYRSIVPTQTAVISGMTQSVQPSAQHVPTPGSLQSVPRVPTSFNAPQNTASSFEKARTPSFHINR